MRFPSQAEIDAAHDAAAGLDTALYVIDPLLTGSEDVLGRIHAWRADGRYLGQFKTHALALQRGAVVIAIDGIWFDYSMQQAQ